jgi:hypothetical protein
MNVLHLVHHSLPYQDGYSLRTHYLARGLTALGYQALVATLPGIQMRMGGSRGAASEGPGLIDGVRYYHHRALAGSPAISGLVARLSKALLEVAPAGVVRQARDLYYRQSTGQPSVLSRWFGLASSSGAGSYYRDLVERAQPLLLHAHTPFLNGRYAVALRERYKLPYL